MNIDIERQVVVRAAIFTLTLVVPTYLLNAVIQKVADVPEDSNYVILPAIALFIEMALGGARAANLKPEAPYTHGALSAIAACVALLVVLIPVSVVTGGFDDRVLDVVAYVVFYLLMFGSAGVFGALVATSWRERSRARRRHAPRR